MGAAVCSSMEARPGSRTPGAQCLPLQDRNTEGAGSEVFTAQAGAGQELSHMSSNGTVLAGTERGVSLLCPALEGPLHVFPPSPLPGEVDCRGHISHRRLWDTVGCEAA